MAIDKRLKNELDTIYARLAKDNTFKGELKPNVTDTHNVGSASKRWNIIYAKEVIADTVSGGGGGGDADTVDGFHASNTPTANYLLALDGSGKFPTSALTGVLLADGSVNLTGNLTVVGGITIDGIDVGGHAHTGGTSGLQISHANLANLGVDDHAQYTQWAQEEVITATWTFSNTADDLDDYYKYVGWEFKTQVTLDGSNNPIPSSTWTRLRTIPFNGVVGWEHDYPIEFYSAGDKSYIQIGTAGEVYIQVDGNDERIWAGNALPASAPFVVDKLGNIKANAGTIAGWDLSASAISKNNLSLNSAGSIVIGDGPTDIITLSAADATYMLWAGAATGGASLFSIDVGGNVRMAQGYVTGFLQSNNYISTQQGWSIESDGFAEFSNIYARGIIESAVFRESAISVVAGRTLITDGSVFSADVADTDTSITIEAQIFATDDIVHCQPDGSRSEWMRITDDGTSVAAGWEYNVTRDLDGSGANDFYIGETIFRKGAASAPGTYGFQLADYDDGQLGAYSAMLGGGSYTSYGGYVTLDGTRQYGPYVGVARRFGATYSQIEDILRLGRLKGFLGIVEDAYGFAAGRSGNFMKYDEVNGLEIQTADGMLQVNNGGLFVDNFALFFQDTAPSYSDGEVRFWVDSITKTLRARYKDGVYETEDVIHTF